MDCPNIGNVTFSQMSKDTIEDIRRRKDLSNALIKLTGAGHVINIFLGNGMLESTYSLYSTDFETMANAMAQVPGITKRRISDIAEMTALKVSDYKERQFWLAVSSGCSVY